MSNLREEHERLKNRLRDEVTAEHERYKAQEGDTDAYRCALRRLNDFLIDGILPEESLKYKALCNSPPGPGFWIRGPLRRRNKV